MTLTLTGNIGWFVQVANYLEHHTRAGTVLMAS